ncbi:MULTISPECIES: dephospho-CoA kinase [Arenibacter]|uniref:dephospho-CoA kinase n=1 Tax=Arenibacter TaxID=178469 RepID=UPI0004DFC28E|nr:MULTISPECIES: dephospho-CoA kinase [Arenibacter]GBF21503.1 dephospho-CoA kinase [Arenibacter sp. NBRC 103722]
MIIVGLTGGIGSGKSTVGSMFQKLGVPIYNSDAEAKNLMASSKKIKNEIEALLGKESYLEGKPNKEYIAKIVFKDKKLLQGLNNIVHPAVRRHFKSWCKRQNAPYVIQEAAIIFENGADKFYDKIILVTSPKDIRIQRVVDRDGATAEAVMSRIDNQLPDSEKEKLSDFIIENIGLEETEREVFRIHHKLLKIRA